MSSRRILDNLLTSLARFKALVTAFPHSLLNQEVIHDGSPIIPVSAANAASPALVKASQPGPASILLNAPPVSLLTWDAAPWTAPTMFGKPHILLLIGRPKSLPIACLRTPKSLPTAQVIAPLIGRPESFETPAMMGAGTLDV